MLKMSFLQVENNRPFSKSDLQMKTSLAIVRYRVAAFISLFEAYLQVVYTLKVENMN